MLGFFRGGDDEQDPKELRKEAEELRSKLEAIQAAEYREKQRIAVKHEAVRSGKKAKRREHGLSLGDEDEDEDELDRMYDFSVFNPGDASPIHVLKARHESLRERQEVLERQVEDQERKLSTAGAALQKARGQVQHLTARLGLRELDMSKSSTQVEQLRGLLIEKEQRLQAALDEAEAALAGEQRAQAEEPQASTDAAQSPPEPEALQRKESREPSLPEGSPIDSEQVLALARITEELTDALEVSRANEAQARNELAEARRKLQNERSVRKKLKETSSDELERLRERVQQTELELSSERAKYKEIQDRAKRAEIEEFLQQKLASKGKQFHQHLEV